ncbi:N-acetylmuramoyl-L-alanine amidase [Segatella copri]|uniref:N-acetylmuramoyl-L-alanine amidase n=2 Tax=Segatella copri TaxID=165179 RepID=A0AA90UUK5_9BACT|nr:N-acetylmuramoyl-L-alanine amidase [Segatella copri]MQN70336.1 N-acetylmuramoyl-L-alanine amidase [Segatella copri]MQN79356.1 N-acetylmuramoyl-L-alanine amidase [Segatella copri]MQO00745.1 N-acetylmuramoyl-L-alanine amidase [Segatella copri]
MKNQRKIDLIVVHCSATRINQDFPVEALEACHKARGFHSIGYHYYITKDGVVYPCRPESEEGAHARHYNAHSIGICYEGGLDEKGKPADTRTPAQKASLEDRKYPLNSVLHSSKKCCTFARRHHFSNFETRIRNLALHQHKLMEVIP